MTCPSIGKESTDEGPPGRPMKACLGGGSWTLHKVQRALQILILIKVSLMFIYMENKMDE